MKLFFKKIAPFLAFSTLTGTSFFVASCSSYQKQQFEAKHKHILNEIKKNNISIIEEGAILLKNKDFMLPLNKDRTKISAFSINNYELNMTNYKNEGGNLVNELKNNNFKINPILDKIYQTRDKKYISNWQHKNGFEQQYVAQVNEMPISEILSQNPNVIQSFKNYNTALFTITRGSGEVHDLEPKYLELTKEERDLLTYINNNFKDIIVLINSPTQMPLGWIDEFKNIKAVLNIGIPGQFSLDSIIKILTGEINPSGRLVDTYSYDYLTSPNNINYVNTFRNVIAKCSPEISSLPVMMQMFYKYLKQNAFSKYVVYQEGIYVGYKYYETRYYDKIKNKNNVGNYDYDSQVQFPIGYGLSYTDFEYSNFAFDSKDTDNNANTIDISVTVKNIGKRAGKDSVILYLSKPYTQYDINNGIEKSAIEIVDYNKTKLLKPNEEETLSYHIDKSMFKTYDQNKAKTYIDESGDYYFSIGDNAHDALNNMIKNEDSNSHVNGNKSNSIKYIHKTRYANIDGVDDKTYSFSQNGTKIKNLFDKVDFKHYYNDFKYLTRNNWVGTFPTVDTTKKEATNELINDLKKEGLEYDGFIDDKDLNKLPNDDFGNKELKDNIDFWTNSGVREYFNNEREFNFSWTDGPQGIELKGKRLGPSLGILSSTLNKDIQNYLGQVNGKIAQDLNISFWAAPSINIHRNYLCGRNHEYSSEDNIITSNVAININNGFNDTSNGIITLVKHLVLNESETYRMGLQTFINEQAFREQYLSIIDKLIEDSNMSGVMGSLNRIGTTWASASHPLIIDYLKGELGFNGFVTTDMWETGHAYMQQKLIYMIENQMMDHVLMIYDPDFSSRVYNIIKRDKNLIESFNLIYDSLLNQYYSIPNSRKNFWDKLI